MDAGDEEAVDSVADFPVDDIESEQVLFVMHGVLRNASEYATQWKDFAKRYNLFLLCPQFSFEEFPGNREFQYGCVYDEKNKRQSPKYWIYGVIEQIFEYLLRIRAVRRKEYNIFGHSAGAQVSAFFPFSLLSMMTFHPPNVSKYSLDLKSLLLLLHLYFQFVHRLVIMTKNSRLRRAVCANAGWYTFVDSALRYPYGIRSLKLNEEHLRRVFSRRLTIMVGQEDVKSRFLRQTKEAQAQGCTRYVSLFIFKLLDFFQLVICPTQPSFSYEFACHFF